MPFTVSSIIQELTRRNVAVVGAILPFRPSAKLLVCDPVYGTL